jgi:hypothetical protein
MFVHITNFHLQHTYIGTYTQVDEKTVPLRNLRRNAGKIKYILSPSPPIQLIPNM